MHASIAIASLRNHSRVNISWFATQPQKPRFFYPPEKYPLYGIYGDPHIVTLDGHKYTFNGKGEFILIQTTSYVFALQGRMEQAIDPEGTPSPGTVFTAIVAKQVSSNTSVQFEVNPNEDSLLVMVDAMSEEFDGVSILELSCWTKGTVQFRHCSPVGLMWRSMYLMTS